MVLYEITFAVRRKIYLTSLLYFRHFSTMGRFFIVALTLAGVASQPPHPFPAAKCHFAGQQCTAGDPTHGWHKVPGCFYCAEQSDEFCKQNPDTPKGSCPDAGYTHCFFSNLYNAQTYWYKTKECPTPPSTNGACAASEPKAEPCPNKTSEFYM